MIDTTTGDGAVAPSTAKGPGEPGPPSASPDESSAPDGSAGKRPPGSVAIALALAAMVLVGVGAVMLADVIAAEPEATLVGSNAPVNDGAGDPMDLSSHNSPVVARNPTDAANVVVANRKDNPDFGCALHVSTDGAASFSATSLPVPEPQESKCFAPDVGFGPDGRLYVLFVTLRGQGNRPHAVWLSTSDDGGQTLSEPTRLLGELSFQVGLTVDPEQPGQLYVTWLDAEDTATLAFPDTGYPVRFMTSDDGGDTWSEPVAVSDPARERVVAPRLAVGAEGHLQLVYLDLGQDRLDWAGGHEGYGGPPYPDEWELVAARSGDGGATWEETSVGTLRPPKRILVFLPEFPTLAVDRERDRLYAAYHARVDGDASVWLWRSEDAGATWDGPVEVDGAAPGDGTDQYLPQVDVAPTGRVDVVYYDRQADDANVMNEVALASSHDAGASFTTHRTISDRAFDSRIGFGGHRDMADLGSRLGLLSTSDRALAVWSDTRAGTEASEKQDLVRQAVAFDGAVTAPAGATAALRFGGTAVAVVGGALLVWRVGSWWRRRRGETT